MIKKLKNEKIVDARNLDELCEVMDKVEKILHKKQLNRKLLNGFDELVHYVNDLGFNEDNKLKCLPDKYVHQNINPFKPKNEMDIYR